MMKRTFWVTATIVATICGSLGGQQVDTSGTGWALTRLDLDVAIYPTDRRIAVEADLVVRLTDHDGSTRIALAMNSRDSIMAFDSVTTPSGAVVAMNASVPGRPAMRQVIIDLAGQPAARGGEVRLHTFASSRATSNQFTLAEDITLASWVTGWYPVPLPSPGGSLSNLAKAPGKTRLDIPANWRAVSNGIQTDTITKGGRRTEQWTTEQPLARSFAAGPYRVVQATANGRRVELLLLTVGDAEARVQVGALAQSIVALERRFGPYPTGSYAIAEVPDWVPGFLAASEQGFMMAKPANFSVPSGNIPLFAHEAAHGYWGNELVSSGRGSAFLSESISQYAAVIALEEILGPEAALSFLKFSREGYIPLQSARGYFEVIRRGADSVAIADMANISGMAKRIVVDSKGPWIYHMLRHSLGDELFFASLRSYFETHRDGSSNLRAFREFMTEAAPEAGLEAFFAQWLDRTGAPHLEISWTSGDGILDVVLAQTQEGSVYTLDIDIRIDGADGSSVVHTIHSDQRRVETRVPVVGRPTAVTIDPEFKILRWDETYRMPGN